VGKLLALVLVLVSVAAVAGLLYRPGAVIGVSGKSLAYSIRGEAEADETGACTELGGEEERFTCTVLDSDRKVLGTYAVETKDAGCWDAKRRGAEGGSEPATLSGCITISDLIRTGD
jgi:hypothetical protein